MILGLSLRPRGLPAALRTAQAGEAEAGSNLAFKNEIATAACGGLAMTLKFLAQRKLGLKWDPFSG